MKLSATPPDASCTLPIASPAPTENCDCEDYIKNHPDRRGHGWEPEWIGALPGKRENIRYEGDHILTWEDIEGQGQFPDLIAHGGWTMDDHPPKGIHHTGKDTTHHAAPSPYGIPSLCVYSKADFS